MTQPMSSSAIIQKTKVPATEGKLTTANTTSGVYLGRRPNTVMSIHSAQSELEHV